MSVQLDPIFGCEVVTTRLDRDGYAYHGKSRAHIVAWTRARGPVPDGLELDHLCRNRACKALHHLQPITRSEQEKRKSFAYRLRIVTCQRGHDMTRHRAVTPSGGVTCGTCNREALERRGVK